MGRPGQSRALLHRGAKVERLRRWARVIRRDALTLWLAARDPRVPVVVKLLAACVAAYALSPIDLIPDFIPILGYVDDLVIVPLGLLLVIRMIPDEVLADLRQRAAAQAEQPRSMAGAVAVVAAWLVVMAVFARWLYGVAY